MELRGSTLTLQLNTWALLEKHEWLDTFKRLWVIPSLKLTAKTPENRPKRPNRKPDRIPVPPFLGVNSLSVSGSVN